MTEQTNIYTTTTGTPPSLFRRISWGAIIAGLIIALVTQVTLTLLGTAIGAATIEPTREAEPAKGLAIGSAIWLLFSGLISMYVGGCVAGRFCGGPRRSDGLLHGFLTWGTATLAALLLLTTAVGAMFGGAIGLVTRSVAAGGDPMGAAPMLAGVVQSNTRIEVQEAARLAAKNPQLGAALTRMFSRGGAEAAPAERDAVINILVTQHNMTQEQAANTVNRWNQQYQQIRVEAEQQGREVGESAAKGVSKAAFWGFLTLLLGAAVASWGGWSGAASLYERGAVRTDVRVPA